jgi:hypothetical protein
MSAQQPVLAHEVDGEQMLDVDTSAAIMRWLETAQVPDGVDPERWQDWVDAGCSGPIERRGVSLTPAMLGAWARTGLLR